MSDPNNPAVLSQNGVELELASLRQSLAPIRFVFRSSAHTEGAIGFGFGFGELLPIQIPTPPVLAGPVMIEKSGRAIV